MRYIALATGALVAAQIMIAQVDSGAISGTVKDSSGGVIASATVKITQTDTGIIYRLLTNGDGFYSAPSLQVNRYDISVSAVGFDTETRKAKKSKAAVAGKKHKGSCT